MKTISKVAVVFFVVVLMLFGTVSASAKFTDVDAATKYYEAIDTMSQLGIILGSGDGTFRPNDLVRRDEMAKLIFVTGTTFTEAGSAAAKFTDVPEDHWAYGFIGYCSDSGIVAGIGDGTFNPAGNVTYDQALKMTCGMLGFTDFKSDMWPTDVRTKGIKELKLNEGLDVTDGNKALTRGEVAQILYNSLFREMSYTRDAHVYKEGYFSDPDATEATTLAKKIQVAKVLATDVWNLEIKKGQIVATESYGYSNPEKGIESNKTGKEDVITVYYSDEDEYVDYTLEELGLEEYDENTDSIILFNIRLMYRDGELMAGSSVAGAHYDSVSISSVSTGKDSVDSESVKVGGSIFFKHKINISGTVYEDGNDKSTTDDDYFSNLRAYEINSTGDKIVVVNLQSKKKPYLEDGITPNPDYNTYILPAPDPGVNYFYYAGYSYHAEAIDANGDGKIDFLTSVYVQPYKVLSVTKVAATSDEEEHSDITYRGLYEGDSSKKTISSLKVNYAKGFEEGDVFVAAPIGDRLYFDSLCTVVEAVATSRTASNVTLEGTGKVSKAAFVGVTVTEIPSSETIMGLDDNGNKKVYKYWIYKNKVVDSCPVEEDLAEYKTAILLYADKKSARKFNEQTKKYETYYPANLLINGKEEVVNLNSFNAINGASGEYVSADGSEWRASNNADGTINFLYTLVNYTVDKNGYYTLSTEGDTVKNDKGEVIEVVVPAGATLSYNKKSGLYSISYNDGNDDITIDKITLDGNSYLYYNYTKSATGKYEYLSFYTSDTMPENFEDVTFKSNGYVTYDKKTDIYTIASVIITDKIESADGQASTYTDDARYHLIATDESVYTLQNDCVYFNYSFMNLSTGEEKSDLNTKTEAEDATPAETNYLYAWDKDLKNYVKVKSTLDCLGVYTVTDYMDSMALVFTDESEYENGLKIEDDTKIYALDENGDLITLDFDDIVSIIDAVKDYNEANSASEEIKIAVGTYVEDKEEKIAYVLIDYVRVDDDGDFYFGDGSLPRNAK